MWIKFLFRLMFPNSEERFAKNARNTSHIKLLSTRNQRNVSLLKEDVVTTENNKVSVAKRNLYLGRRYIIFLSYYLPEYCPFLSINSRAVANQSIIPVFFGCKTKSCARIKTIVSFIRKYLGIENL